MRRAGITLLVVLALMSVAIYFLSQVRFYPSVGNYIQSLLDMHSQGQLVYDNQSVQVTMPDIVKFVNQYGKFVVD